MYQRKTKIIVTVGPASESVKVLKKLITSDDGMDIVRINCSHGTGAEHSEAVRHLRHLNPRLPIMADLQGPKIRVGEFEGQTVELKKSQTFTLFTRKIMGNAAQASVDFLRLPEVVKEGERILLDDGRIQLKVHKRAKGKVVCKVIEGGLLSAHKGVNLPGAKLKTPSLTAKDIRDVHWAAKIGVDFVALSFVRCAKDVFELKKLLKKLKSEAHVVAKIEKPEALQNLDEIILAADGLMVARGDLGIELSLEKVPFIQKQIIEKCRSAGKPVIVATQMLESMIEEPMPTRAEVSDVANAVLDGADAIMLSGETAQGHFPVKAFLEMSKIAEEAEKSGIGRNISDKVVLGSRLIQQAVGHAACHLAKEVFAKAIVTFTDSGSSALTISKFRPSHRIFGITASTETMRRMMLYFGVSPLMIKQVKHTDDMIRKSEQALLKTGQIRKGDLLVFVAGVPTGKAGTTNLVKVHRIGEGKTLEI